MRFLLDTHALFWSIYYPEQLPDRVRSATSHADVEVFASAVSAYECSYKYGLGKWPEVATLVNAFDEVLAAQDFGLLPLTSRHMVRAGLFPAEHRDPFDRMLCAQAEVEGLTLVTGDRRMNAFGVSVMW